MSTKGGSFEGLDPLTRLAFAMQRDTGVYAVLLGSGVSRGTGVPTGWEITLDLVRQLAASQSEDPGSDPAAWYKAKYGREAGYSELLAQLGLQQAERRKMLVPSFEPSAEDLEAKQKVPTEAHRAIARLVARGYIRVILTTNFDRLMEQALADEGVNPSIIAIPEDIAGMEPLVHARCTLIKLHGDYLDARIKNTVEELKAL